jgi:enamine deaminase RidA (YjgF/YER057c/UK114 family)/catechol 2,3-dioxygenase-like lactoylglutathione lyase family enzyme
MPQANRTTIPNEAPWGQGMKYSRAVRVGNTIEVSGTTAVGPEGSIVGLGDVAAQVKACLGIISDALQGLGSNLDDVVRTRLFVTDASTWQEAGRAHDEVLGAVAPASSLVEVAALLHPDLLVEIEASAIVGSGQKTRGPSASQPEAAREHAALMHTSLTVASLERSIPFYRDVLGMDLVYEQEKTGGYLAEIVGLPDAHVRMAQLSFSGDPHRVELFEYVGLDGQAEPGKPWDRGISHLCLGVADIDAVLQAVRSAGHEAPAPVLVDTGVNRGGRGLYLQDPDGITLELFQRPGNQA